MAKTREYFLTRIRLLRVTDFDPRKIKETVKDRPFFLAIELVAVAMILVGIAVTVHWLVGLAYRLGMAAGSAG